MRARTVGRLAVSMAAVAALVGGTQGPPATAGHVSAPYFDLGALPATDFNGDQIFEGLKQFVNDYPYRLTGGPNEIRAGLALHQEMQGLGYEVVTRSLAPQNVGVDNGLGAGAGLKAVIATKRGTTLPNEWIMFIGHYDTVPQTIYGAYDNGAGTNLIRFLAKEFANVPTNRSMVFVWYNGEEEGLLASAQHAAQLKNAGQAITAVLGFDMVGIAWPVATPTSASCLCMFHGAADKAAFEPLLKFVAHGFLGFPSGLREVRYVGTNDRNSDERSFANQGFRTMRLAGMRTAASYNAYHLPNDTIDNIISVAGGESYYEQGIENTMKIAYYSALTVDNHLPSPSFSSTSVGLTASFDATPSTDEDGPPTTFEWDFGDGTTGDGQVVDHDYAQPGTYAVTLTVSDNLWPTVKRSITMNVTVA